jgi:nicotinamidase-related amidase
MSPKNMINLSEDVGNDIEKIEFVGVVSDICVISNIVTFQSQYVNAQIIVDSNLCASFDEKLHEKAMDVAASLQAKIIR